MRQCRPESCPSAKHPDAGFYKVVCRAGEPYQIKQNNVHRLVFVVRGSCTINSNERNNYHVQEKHFVFCYREFRYEFIPAPDVELVIAYFETPSAACDLGALSQMFEEKKRPFRYEFSAVAFNEAVREFLMPLERYLDDRIACAHMHYAKMDLLFVVFRFYYSTKVQAKLFYNLLDRDVSFVTLVENNRSRAKNLIHLAELCGYSVNKFNILFRRHFAEGLTPHAWLQEQKKAEILHAIQDTDLKLSEIAAKFGYNNAGNFGNYCKRQFGELPSRLRAEYRKERNKRKNK